MCTSDIADWGTAIGTLVLAIATFVSTRFSYRAARQQEKWRRESYRAKLAVFAMTAQPDCVQLPYVAEYDEGGKRLRREAVSYYLRILVNNVGDDTARNVEVYAKELKRQQPNGDWESVEDFPPMNLVWSNSPPLGRTFLPFLAPHSSRHCDLAHALDPKDRSDFPGENKSSLASDKVSLTFDLFVRPLHLGHVIGPGKYRLNIQVAAENVEASSWVIGIDFTGVWKPGPAEMFGERHVHISSSFNC